ncbi:N-6 DNA methylase [Flavobacterium coralii]|uniref:HsdM family class I SAM-dependent methyltransferase n=1 Tax=Flavobacterium coralii TaxID=2838017 RepID=UPI000C6631E8|nr:endonuclease [Flavobacterium sp.]|tara:strand:- start:25840 stop:28926 length:3087 start_codon:yes stop_codon:yes gene_type:complete
MNIDFFIDKLDLGRSVPTATQDSDISDYQLEVIGLARTFGVDKVYFCDDFPAVFLKKVSNFDDAALMEIVGIHHDVWNYKKVLQLYIYSDSEIRIYNCSEKPIYLAADTDFGKETQKIELFRCEKSDTEKLSSLNKIFSRSAIDTGLIWTLEEAEGIRKKINLQRRVDKYLVNSLIGVASKLKEDGILDINLIHKLIMRSLFLLFLEDRNATDEKFYHAIDQKARNYFDILGDVSSTYLLFEELENHFKGNLFTVDPDEQKLVTKEHLSIIKKCFITGFEHSDQVNLFEDWRIFNFNIIEIELLSEIYENFLTAIDSKKKDETGTFYTPPSLVELVLNQKLPAEKGDKDYNIKILDPACGSGIFLVESFKRLVKRYENHSGEKLTDYSILKKILLDNIFGIELDPKAIKVAAFSLYLALLENLNPKTLWQKKELPNLINDPLDPEFKGQGSNLYRRDTIGDNNEIENIEFDLVVGNPPFGTKKLSQSIINYCNEHGFAKEMVLPFLHKSVKFAPHGEIALIFNTKVLTNTSSTYQKFRDWLFTECYVEKIFNFSILRRVPLNLGGQLFGSAVGPISIVFFKKEIPAVQSAHIVYYAPKTYLKMDVLEGIVIDSTDVKYLRRDDCKASNAKIWKIAMWGGVSDINLINKLDAFTTFSDYLNKKKIVEKGLGFQFLMPSTKEPIPDEEIPAKYMPPHNIRRYYSESFQNINEGLTASGRNLYSKHYNVPPYNLPSINIFRRVGAKAAYKAPLLLIKEGLQNWKVCSSYIDSDCSFNSKVLGIHHSDEKILKGLTCYLNSDLVYYYLFMVSASIGIEREEIKPNEIYNLPFNLNDDQLYELAEMYDQEFNPDNFFGRDADSFEKQINKLIYGYFDLSEKSQAIIENAVYVTFPLLFKGSKAPSLLSVNDNEMYSYAAFIKEELSNFLADSQLYASVTTYKIYRYNPLSLVKLSFGKQSEIKASDEEVNSELQLLDRKLYSKSATNIFFRKKLTYFDQNDIFIIRPNQKRFWSQGAAIEDATDLIGEILNMQ